MPRRYAVASMRGEDRLLELQATDLAVDRLKARRADLEAGSELKTARERASRAETRVGELRLALDAIGREQRQLERDIDALGHKRAAEERRMYDGSIVNQKELEALQHEIANIAERRSRLEDDLLERMERFESLEAEVGEAERVMAAERARLDAVGGESQVELQGIEGELADREAARAALAGEIDEELLALYEELRRTKRGVGAAALVDGTCQGCHQTISAVELSRLKRTEGIKRCEYCRRILVFA